MTSYDFSATARADIADAVEYLELQENGLSFRFLDEMQELRASVQRHPPLDNYYRDDIRWRRLPNFRYKMIFYYEPDGDYVMFVGVLHERAGPQAWEDRASLS
jgi:plasmid stabilization system protein ParE